jgi:cell division protein FtsN
MIEINLLKQGHGVLYRQKSIRKNISHQRAKIFLLSILLLTSYLTFHLDIERISVLKYSLITLFFNNLDNKALKNESLPPNNEQKKKTLPVLTPDKIKDPIIIKKHEVPTEIQSKEKISEKNSEKQKVFYVKVASTILSESADIIQKDLLRKGLQSTRGKEKGLAKNFFVVISPEKSQKNLKIIMEKLKDQEVTWDTQKVEKGYQVISQSFVFLKEAERLNKQVIKKGIKGKIIQKKTPTSFHEVRVGNFETRDGAISMLKKLQKKGIQGVIVKR